MLGRAATAAASIGALVAASSLAARARAADDEAHPEESAQKPKPSAANEIPITAYAYSTGVRSGTVGAMGTGSGLVYGSTSTLGGGGTVWGSPLSGLALIADAQRDVTGKFVPSAAVLVRLLGDHTNGWSLGALGKFKVDGFTRGKDGEVETEVESGAVLSFVRERVHFDLNGILGFGLGDDGDRDGEGRLRFGVDLTSFLRLGIDEQARFKLGGVQKLPGNRTWDIAGGPQVLVHWKNFFGAVTAGPTTMGVIDPHAGWMALVSVGAVAL
jgi:hypothetical protein